MSSSSSTSITISFPLPFVSPVFCSKPLKLDADAREAPFDPLALPALVLVSRPAGGGGINSLSSLLGEIDFGLELPPF